MIQHRALIITLAAFAFWPALNPSRGRYILAQRTSLPALEIQQSLPNDDILRVTTHIVVLDVVVTDKNGNLVPNLTADDFTIYENKKMQKIRSFEHTQQIPPSRKVAIGSTSELDKRAPDAPVSIIVLDEYSTRPEDKAFARQSLKRYLKNQGGTLLQPTMLVAVSLNKFVVLRDYTTSEHEVLDALNKHFSTYNWPTQNGNLMADQINSALASLREVAEATAGHHGHKNLIWLGRGFPSLNPTNLDPEIRSSLTVAIARCINTLRDSRVTLYTIDPVGLIGVSQNLDENGFSEEDPFGAQVDFSAIAKASGGIALYGSNDIDRQIDTSFRNGGNFYTLSYSPSTSNDNDKPFRSIHIEMQDPHMRAMTRKGYYVHTAATPMSISSNGTLSDQAAFDLTLAAESTMIYDTVPFTVRRKATDPNTFIVHLDGSSIIWKTEDSGIRSAEFSVLVESYNNIDKMLNITKKLVTAQLPSNSSQNDLNILVHIETAQPAYRLRFVLMVNATGSIGTENYILQSTK